MERKLRNTVSMSKEKLKQNIIEVWQSIDANVKLKSTYSLENRLRAVIAAEGDQLHTEALNFLINDAFN